MEYPVLHRRSNRVDGYNYSDQGGYFVTVCVYEREHLFGKIKNGKMIAHEFGKIVEKFWKSLPQRFPEIGLDKWVVMPNHFHGIVLIPQPVGAIHELPLQTPSKNSNFQNDYRIERRRMLLPKVLGFFKMNTAKAINLLRKSPGQPLWQRNYYEHIIRNDQSLDRIRNYIINNPLSWDLDRENPNKMDDDPFDIWMEKYDRQKITEPLATRPS